MKIKVRRARISDIPQLVDRLENFYEVLKSKGARDIAQDGNVLRGGITIEIGHGFKNPQWFCVVADKQGEIIAFMIGILEYCGPTEETFTRVRVHANYLDEDSFIGPRLLEKMWGEMEEWAKQNGAGYFYANIHPGNQPSVRVAKKIGFKHHYTQFYRPIEMEKEKEVSEGEE